VELKQSRVTANKETRGGDFYKQMAGDVGEGEGADEMI